MADSSPRAAASSPSSIIQVRSLPHPEAAGGRVLAKPVPPRLILPNEGISFIRNSGAAKILPVRAADMLLVPTFVDNFDGPAGAPPDAKHWTHDVGGDGFGNGQLEFNTNRTENTSLDGNGNLRITARREKFGNNDYTSGRIKTEGRFSAQFGRVEARIKLPPGQGIWPAFWMLGDNVHKVGWPACGEIDIMEYRGQFPRDALGTIHGPGYSGAEGISKTLTLPDGGFDKDFHVFACDWDPGKIVFSIDGMPYHTITRDQVLPKGPWAFDDHPFFIILNVAVGGGFAGAPDASTPFPATMLVDYVKVYEKRPKTS
jgi:beta-glucanase (GH16 family)